jgi:hypothetical protein
MAIPRRIRRTLPFALVALAALALTPAAQASTIPESYVYHLAFEYPVTVLWAANGYALNVSWMADRDINATEAYEWSHENATFDWSIPAITASLNDTLILLDYTSCHLISDPCTPYPEGLVVPDAPPTPGTPPTLETPGLPQVPLPELPPDFSNWMSSNHFAPEAS